jgi:hypothetical protein
MALTEGTPGDWQPGSYPAAVQLVHKGDDRSPLPVVHWPAGPVRLPSPEARKGQ